MGKVRTPEPLRLLTPGSPTKRLHLRAKPGLPSSLAKAEEGIGVHLSKGETQKSGELCFKKLTKEYNVLYASVSHFQSKDINI